LTAYKKLGSDQFMPDTQNKRSQNNEAQKLEGKLNLGKRLKKDAIKERIVTRFCIERKFG